MNVPQTSASERMEAARKALRLMRSRQAHTVPGQCRECDDLDVYIDAMSALITPPNVAESEKAIASRVGKRFRIAGLQPRGYTRYRDALEAAVRAGIQAAHETWESADHPSQEMMLRWLGIEYWEGYAYDGTNTWKIAAQSIEKEED